MRITSRFTRLRAVELLFLAALAGVSARPAHAQVPSAADAVEIRKWYLADIDTVHAKMLALAEAFPADKYSWRPAPGVRSVGEAFMHAASEYYTFVPVVYGAQRSPVIAKTREAFANFEKDGTKENVIKHLKEAFAYAEQNINALDPATLAGSHKMFGGDHNIVEMSFGVTDDLHEHLGQLIAYARMNGIVPPWSKPE